jgi:hypothetical protein
MATDGGAYGPGELVERLPVTAGAVFGVVTHFAGLLVTFSLLVVDPEFEFGASRAVQVGAADETGWLFFGAHFARLQRREPFAGPTGAEQFNVLSETTLAFPAVVFHVVPVVLLILGGFALVSGRELWESSTKAHAAAGATVAAGYFPLAAVGIILFETEVGVEGQTLTLAPELSTTLLFVGLAYPLVFGAVGGLLASRLRFR